MCWALVVSVARRAVAAFRIRRGVPRSGASLSPVTVRRRPESVASSMPIWSPSVRWAWPARLVLMSSAACTRARNASPSTPHPQRYVLRLHGDDLPLHGRRAVLRRGLTASGALWRYGCAVDSRRGTWALGRCRCLPALGVRDCAGQTRAPLGRRRCAPPARLCASTRL